MIRKDYRYVTMIVGAGTAIFSGGLTGTLIDGHLMNTPIEIHNKSLEAEILAFAKISAMAEIAEDISDNISVSFVLGNIPIDPSPDDYGSGDEFFMSVIDSCSIHSEENFEPLCFICKLSNSSGKLLAQGIVGETFDEIYQGSSTVTIKLQSDPLNPYSNEVQKVQNVEVQICGPLEDSEPNGVLEEGLIP